MGTERKSLLLRAKLAVAAARIGMRERRAALRAAAGTTAGRIGRRLLLGLHRGERIEEPRPLAVGGAEFDVLEDLRAYTGLPPQVVAALVARRLDSFRVEWLLAPEELRADEWYYRATSAYLFGNAIHVHDDPTLLSLVSADSPGRALDFGGGTGNLSLALAALGWNVDYVERSAIQKDFVRFRKRRYELSGSLRVVDDWEPLEPRTYDLVCAIDVLEHVGDLDGLLRKRLLPALRPGGRLVEASPFHRTLSNPMHHEHTHLDELLSQVGLRLETHEAPYRVWRLDAPSQLSS